MMSVVFVKSKLEVLCIVAARIGFKFVKNVYLNIVMY